MDPSQPSQTPRYQKLQVWELGMDIAEMVFRYTSKFPKSEQFGITAQLRKAAVSVPSNIAEGAARRGTAELLYFVTISAGSVNELETQLMLSDRLGFLPKSDYNAIMRKVGEESRKLNRMRGTLERRIAGKSNR
jgi:four helix bundle protein